MCVCLCENGWKAIYLLRLAMASACGEGGKMYCNAVCISALPSTSFSPSILVSITLVPILPTLFLPLFSLSLPLSLSLLFFPCWVVGCGLQYILVYSFQGTKWWRFFFSFLSNQGLYCLPLCFGLWIHNGFWNGEDLPRVCFLLTLLQGLGNSHFWSVTFFLATAMPCNHRGILWVLSSWVVDAAQGPG